MRVKRLSEYGRALDTLRPACLRGRHRRAARPVDLLDNATHTRHEISISGCTTGSYRAKRRAKRTCTPRTRISADRSPQGPETAPRGFERHADDNASLSDVQQQDTRYASSDRPSGCPVPTPSRPTDRPPQLQGASRSTRRYGMTSSLSYGRRVELHVALLAPDASAPVTWKVQNEARAVERLRRKLEKAAAGPVACCYEAGPCGYALQRQLERGRVQCQMIAPALVPRKPGERIKTDRRDARKLAELHRAGLLTEVRPPTPAEEAVRDLCRARDDARADRQRCRHRLGKLLLRRGLHYPGRAWTQAHRRWVNGLTWPHPADRVVLDDYLLAIDQLDARLAELDAQLATVATTDPYREPVGWLRCFRGIDTLTAMLLLAELHDVQRFPTARALMAYLGLVPGEHSSGERHRRGPITKTGNTLARRLVVVEAAWHYRHRPGVSRTLAQRRSGQPPRVVALADKAQQRLCRRFRRLAEHKPGPVVTVAVARELVGFLWAALHQESA